MHTCFNFFLLFIKFVVVFFSFTYLIYANIKFNPGILIQEDSVWFLGKDKVVSQITPSETARKGSKVFSVQETPPYKTIETEKVEVQKEKDVQIASLPKVIPEPKKPVLAKKDKFTLIWMFTQKNILN